VTDRREWKRDGYSLVALKGDIAAQECDALVNAANSHLWMGSGVAGALKETGGEVIEREAIAKGPIEVGEAIWTTAGHLSARWVIHAAAMGQDLRTNGELVYRAARSALSMADELGAVSIALPALGTGVGGLALEDCARSMSEALEDAAPFTNLNQVRFVLYGPRAYQVFVGIFDETALEG